VGRGVVAAVDVGLADGRPVEVSFGVGEAAGGRVVGAGSKIRQAKEKITRRGMKSNQGVLFICMDSNQGVAPQPEVRGGSFHVILRRIIYQKRSRSRISSMRIGLISSPALLHTP
jgi:hypothetical protein